MSVNFAWKGRRFKSDAYKAYVQEVSLKLRSLELPDPPYTLVFEWGFSNPASDYDNPIKPFQDILQKCYGFDDKEIYSGVQIKTQVPKGEEYVKFRFLHQVDLACLFTMGEGDSIKCAPADP